MDLYTAIKFFHVVFAIVAFGWNASYGFWLARAARQPKETQLFTLRTIKLMDDRVANPLYGLLLLTGLAMTFTAGLPLTTRWILSALVLYVVALVMAFTLIAPNFRKALAALETEGPEGATYRSLMARGRRLGMIIGVIVLAIVFLMVTKPAV